MPLPSPDRSFPNTETHEEIAGTTYADKVAAEGQALWDRVVNVISNVGGSANSITGACDPPLIADYGDGQVFVLTAALNNTGAVVIDIDSRGQISLLRNNGDPLEADDLVADEAVLIRTTGGSPGDARLMSPAPGQLGSAVALANIEVFTASGTWTKPAGLHHVVVHVVGGGGGAGSGGNGGTSSFGSHCSATGGGGSMSGSPGSGSAGDINLTGESGLLLTTDSVAIGGGAPGPFGGGAQRALGNGLNYGGGARGTLSGNPMFGHGGGYAFERIAEASLGASETVTVGAGGDATGSGSQDGAPGVVVVENYVFL